MSTETRPLTDFTSGLDQFQFMGEVNADGIITPNLDAIHTLGLTTVEMEFASALTAPMVTQLDVLIAAHVPTDGGAPAFTPTPNETVSLTGTANFVWQSSTGSNILVLNGETINVENPLEMCVLTPADIPSVPEGSATLYIDVNNGLTCVESGGASGPFQMNLGAYFQEEESEEISSTTNGTFQTKLSLTTPTLPSGNYRLGWTASIKGGGEARARVDDGTTTYTSSAAITPTDYNAFGGFKHFSALSGAHTFNIKYRALSGTAFIKEARLEFWRTS